MSHARRLIVLASITIVAFLGIAGCAGDHKATSADQKSDHPKSDHPKGDHPK